MSKKVFGWITPTGRFVDCPAYNHLEIIEKDTELSSIPKVKELIQYLDGIRYDCQEISEREGSWNAEWHVYTMACDENIPKIYEALLNAGSIRVGEWDNTLHFEGRPNVIKNRFDFCKNFAESYGAEYKFEPQR